MNQSNENSNFSSNLSANQIEVLQQQIRQFKALGKRFNESRLPKLVEEYNQSNSQIVSKSAVNLTETEPVVPSLSWQCVNALLLYGPPKAPQENSISFAPSVRDIMLT